MARAHPWVAGSFLLVALAVSPDPRLEPVELPVPIGMVPLPSEIEVGGSKLRAFDGGVALHLFDVRVADPSGCFSLRAPLVIAGFDGRIEIPRADVELVPHEPAAPERSDALAVARDVRDALSDILSRIPLNRIGSISAHEIAVNEKGAPRTRGARIDLARDGDRLRGLLHLGSVLPQAELFVEIGEGSIALEAEIGPIAGGIDEARVRVVQAIGDRAIRAERIEASIDGTEIAGAGSIDDLGFELEARADRATLAKIEAHWPEEIASSARRFLERHVPRGIVSDVEVWANQEDLSLDFAFSQGVARVPGVPLPIRNARGRGNLTLDQLKLRVASARVGELRSRGMVRLSGFRSEGRLAVEADLIGPASSAMRLVEEAPFPPGSVRGKTELHVSVKAPFDGGIDAKKLRFDVRGTGKQIALDGVRLFDRFAFEDGELQIRADHRRFEIEGRAKIDGVPLEIAWQSPDQIRVRGTLDRSARTALGISEIEGVSGPIDVDLEIDPDDDRARISGTLDLSRSVIEVPLLGYEKKIGRSAEARFEGEIAQKGSVRVRRFVVRGPELRAEGSLELDESQAMKVLRVRVDHRESDFALRWSPDRAVLYGDSFDARPVWRCLSEGKHERDDVNRRIHLDLKRMIVARDVRLEQVLGVIRVSSGRIVAASGSAQIGGASLSVRAHGPGKTLEVQGETSDAGELARALGIDTSISGGRARISGTLTRDLQFQGRARVRDISIDRPPAALSAVSATSIRGIVDLIRDGRLRFGRADVRFAVDGQRIAIAKAVFEDGPIGLSTRGYIDLDDGRTQLVARIAPLDDLNFAVRQIPFLGKLLAPEGDGLLFAPSYSVVGDLEAPKVRLQPQSLIPAFIRRIFTREPKLLP